MIYKFGYNKLWSLFVCKKHTHSLSLLDHTYFQWYLGGSETHVKSVEIGKSRLVLTIVWFKDAIHQLVPEKVLVCFLFQMWNLAKFWTFQNYLLVLYLYVPL